jgi:hypothetical protein
MTLPEVDPKELAKLKRRVRNWLAAKRRRAARRRPLHPPINWDEVAEISAWLDARAQDPDEWS